MISLRCTPHKGARRNDAWQGTRARVDRPGHRGGMQADAAGLGGACSCAFFVEAALVQWTRTGSREGRMPNEKE